MHHCQIEGYRFAYHDVGQGQPIIMLHCSKASHRQWLLLIERLQDRYRILVPDLLGYGDTDRLRPGESFHPAVEVAMIQHLLEQAGEPAHLIGHSYGGALALEVARSTREAIKSLALIEPMAFQLLLPGGRLREWTRVDRVARAVIAAQKAGDSKAAARIYMGFWIGRIQWLLTPRATKQDIIDTMDRIAVEFAALPQLHSDLEGYSALTVPVTLLQGQRSRKEISALIQVLANALPKVQVTNISGAGHMSPFIYADKISALLLEHLERCD